MGLDDFARPLISFGAAALGNYLAGPLGGAIGWGLGMGVGGALFPPEAEKTTAQSMGPAQQLTPTSTIGGVVPVLYGSRRIAGNLIWYAEPTTTQDAEILAIAAILFSGDDYTAGDVAKVSFAYGICIGTASITRIYDGKKEYACYAGAAYLLNVGENVPVEYMNLSPYETLLKVIESGAEPSFYYTEYNGNQTTADPTIVAAKGANVVPPYRNLHYVVFNDFPLKNASAPIPSLTFECTSIEIEDDFVETVVQYGDDDYAPCFTFALLGHIYTVYTTLEVDASVPWYIRKIDKVNPTTLAVVASVSLTDDDGTFDRYTTEKPWNYYATDGTLVIKTATTILKFDAGSLGKISRHHLGKVIMESGRYFYAWTYGAEAHEWFHPPTGDFWQTLWTEIIDGRSDGYVGTWQDGFNGGCWGTEETHEGVVYQDVNRNGFYQIAIPNYIVEEGPWGRTAASWHPLNRDRGTPIKIWYHAPYYYVVYEGVIGTWSAAILGIHKDSYQVEKEYSISNVEIVDACFNKDASKVILVGNTNDNDGWMAVVDKISLALLYGPFTYADVEFTACADYEGYSATPSLSHDHVFVSVTDVLYDYTQLYAISYSTGTVAETFDALPGVTAVRSMTSSGNRGMGYVFGCMHAISETSQFKFSLLPQQYDLVDVTPQDVSAEILTNEFYGEGLDTAVLETTMTAEAEVYAIDNDLLMSLVFDQQQSVLNALQYVAQQHNGFFTTGDGLIAHRQLELDDEVIAWQSNTALSDIFSDETTGDQWKVIGDSVSYTQHKVVASDQIAIGEQVTLFGLPWAYILPASQGIALSESLVLIVRDYNTLYIGGVGDSQLVDNTRMQETVALSGPPNTITKYVSTGADDGFAQDSDLRNAYTPTVGTLFGVMHMISFYRFIDITVPQGTTITSATLTVVVDSNSVTDSFNMRTYCKDVDNASQPSTASYVEDTGTYTTAYTTSSVTSSWSGSKDIDVTSAVQEVINRSGWSSGNALLLIQHYNDASDELIYFNDYESGSPTIPKLTITY